MNSDIPAGGLTYELNQRYLLSVYVFFRHHEEELDAVQLELYEKIQRRIFQGMTLEEVENIETFYLEHN